MEAQKLLLIAVVMVLVDIPWLWYIGDKFGSMVQKIQGGRPMDARLFAAIPVYLAMAWLLTRASDMKEAFFIGACTYAVYDFTSMTIFQGYDLSVALMDTVWGGVLFTIAYWLGKQFKLL
jgi:uncharacterized membrane protein